MSYSADEIEAMHGEGVESLEEIQTAGPVRVTTKRRKPASAYLLPAAGIAAIAAGGGYATFKIRQRNIIRKVERGDEDAQQQLASGIMNNEWEANQAAKALKRRADGGNIASQNAILQIMQFMMQIEMEQTNPMKMVGNDVGDDVAFDLGGAPPPGVPTGRRDAAGRMVYKNPGARTMKYWFYVQGRLPRTRAYLPLKTMLKLGLVKRQGRNFVAIVGQEDVASGDEREHDMAGFGRGVDLAGWLFPTANKGLAADDRRATKSSGTGDDEG